MLAEKKNKPLILYLSILLVISVVLLLVLFPSVRQSIFESLKSGIADISFYLNRLLFQEGEELTLQGETQVTNLTNNGDAYEGSSVDNPVIPKYEKFELTFDIEWYKDRQFDRTPAKYDPLADEWTQNITHALPYSVSWKGKIYSIRRSITPETNKEPGTPEGSTIWRDMGNPINPFWPYDSTPAANSYTTWQAGISYSMYDRVIHNGIVYKCIRDIERQWEAGKFYYNYDSGYPSDSSPHKYVLYGGFAYKNITSNPMGETATLDNGPEGPHTIWEKVGPVDFADYEPNGSGDWQTYWMANPSDPVETKKGISVDGLFLPPGESDWNNAIIQPAFYYQDYESLNGDDDYLVPKGMPQWKLRFAPTQLGQYQYKIRITDASGITQYSPPTNTFAAINSDNRGYVKVSPNDNRYFETSDGKYLNLVGTEVFGYTRADGTHGGTKSLNDLNQAYPLLQSYGMNILREWWNPSWGPPSVFGIIGQGGFIEVHSATITSDAARPGDLFAMTPLPEKFNVGRAGARPRTKPNTRYRLSAWVKTEGLVGTGEYGVALGVDKCVEHPGTIVRISDIVKADGEWTFLSAYFTTVDDHPCATENHVQWPGVTGGKIYYTDLSLREVLGDGMLSGESNLTPSFNHYKWVCQRDAYYADKELELAKQYGIYLKIALMEKLDSAYCMLQPDGTASTAGYSPSNFYGNAPHASRTYQQYFWRYIIARYGYSTNIHSFEVTNEGDPFNGGHYNQTQAMAKFFKENDPNKHLVSTSNWHSFPSYEFWANPEYPDVPYADWHRHVGPWSQGWEWTSRYQDHGWKPIAPITDVEHRGDGGSSMHVVAEPDAFAQSPGSMPFAITPGHTYTISWWVKGTDIESNQGPVLSVANGSGWWTSGPGAGVRLLDGTGRVVGSHNFPGQYDEQGNEGLFFPETFDWMECHATFGIEPQGYYMIVVPALHGTTGEVWFDDITLHDDTTGEDVYVPNGSFDNSKLDEDTALINFGLGTQVGVGSSRAVQKPVMDSNVGIVYAPAGPGEQNYGLNRDTAGIWYKKFVWGQINPYGVISLYYNVEQNLNPPYSFLNYAKAYQNFMADIPLSNGNYQDAKAVTSNRNLRAWGQKDLISSYFVEGDTTPVYLSSDDFVDRLVAKGWNATEVDTGVQVVVVSNYPWGEPIGYYQNRLEEDAGIPSQSDPGVVIPRPVSSWTASEDFTPTYLFKVTYLFAKDGTLGGAHLWIDNVPYTWKNVVDGNIPPPVSGAVTISGFAVGNYKIEWWNTSTGEIIEPEGYTSSYTTSDGNIILTIPDSNPLVSDIAVKVTPETTPAEPAELINLGVDDFANTCCGLTDGARIRLKWTDEGDTQSAYQIQTDNNSDFSSPEINTGKVPGTSQEFVNNPPTYSLLSWNTLYSWRLKVWEGGKESDWISGRAFTTPEHSYPFIDFDWSPKPPEINKEVIFTNNSKVYGAKDPTWAWKFPNGIPTNSDEKNPSVTFSTSSPKTVELTTTDPDGGFSCASSKTVDMKLLLPEWKEIPPF